MIVLLSLLYLSRQFRICKTNATGYAHTPTNISPIRTSTDLRFLFFLILYQINNLDIFLFYFDKSMEKIKRL